MEGNLCTAHSRIEQAVERLLIFYRKVGRGKALPIDFGLNFEESLERFIVRLVSGFAR